MTDPNRDYPPESASSRLLAHEEAGAAPDAAALALRDMAQRLKRTEERSEKAFGAVGDNLRRILARLDEVERKLEAGGGSAGAGLAGPAEGSAAQAAQIEALVQRLEDMSDALAAASGDIEAIRRRIDQGPGPSVSMEAAGGVQAPPTAELMRALNARLEQTRAEAARAGGSAERAAREALAQAGESSRRADEVSVKLTRALASVAARVDAFEKRVLTPPPAVLPLAAAPLAAAGPALTPPPGYEPGIEAPDDYGHKDVAPYVARVERELDAVSGSRGSNFFDRIAAAAEARVNVGRIPRAKEESYVAERVGAAAEAAGEAYDEEPYTRPPPSPAARAPTPPPPPPPAAAYEEEPEQPPLRAAPPPPRARERDPEPVSAPQPAPVEEEPYLGDLAVVPGRKARSGGPRAPNAKNEFDAAFAEEEEPDVSVEDLRSRLRAKPAAVVAESAADKKRAGARRKGKADPVEAEDDEEEAPKKKGGLLGFLRRGKADDDEEEEDELERPGKKGKAAPAKAASRRGQDKEELAAFEAELEDEDDELEDWEDEVSRGRGKRLVLLIGLVVLAAVIGFALIKLLGKA